VVGGEEVDFCVPSFADLHETANTLSFGLGLCTTDFNDRLIPLCIKSVLYPIYSVILCYRRRPAPFPGASFTMTMETLIGITCATSALCLDPVPSFLAPIPTGHSICCLRPCPSLFFPALNLFAHSNTTACKRNMRAVNKCKRWSSRVYAKHRVPGRAGLGNQKTT